MQSVQDVMQQDMSAALQTFSHEATGAPGFMLSVGQKAGRSSGKAQPNTRAPYGVWFSRSEHAGTSSMLSSRRDPSSSTFTAADAIRCVNENRGSLRGFQTGSKTHDTANLPTFLCRLSRRFESSRTEAANRRGPQEGRESAGELVQPVKLHARDAAAAGDFPRRPSSAVEFVRTRTGCGPGEMHSHHALATARRARLRELRVSARGDHNSPQTIARRTIHAEVPGSAGGLWRREDMRIQFTPWDGQGKHAGAMSLDHRDSAPPGTQGLDLIDLEALETSVAASSYLPRPVVASNAGTMRVQGRNQTLKGEELYLGVVSSERRPSVESKITDYAGTVGRHEKFFRFYTAQRQQRVRLFHFLLFVWRGHVNRRRVLDRIQAHVELRLVEKGSAFAIGRECEVLFKAWKKRSRRWREKNRALGVVHRYLFSPAST
jgi:hypothetical protein